MKTKTKQCKVFPTPSPWRFSLCFAHFTHKSQLLQRRRHRNANIQASSETNADMAHTFGPKRWRRLQDETKTPAGQKRVWRGWQKWGEGNGAAKI